MILGRLPHLLLLCGSLLVSGCIGLDLSVNPRGAGAQRLGLLRRAHEVGHASGIGGGE
jgi:hypothetical protein